MDLTEVGKRGWRAVARKRAACDQADRATQHGRRTPPDNRAAVLVPVQLAVLVLASLLARSAAGAGPAAAQLLADPGFENTPPGKLETGTTGQGWEVQRIGRQTIQDGLVVECVGDRKQAHAGHNVLKLGLPKDAVGFEFVTIGQRLRLQPDREYEAAVWVRWPDGPKRAPAGAGATSGHPSAIVSFWARHTEARGDFAGRDVWLFDRQWKRLTIRFRATDPGQRTLIYVSLLPNQTPRDTTVLLDDLTVTETHAPGVVAQDGRDLVVDGGFDKREEGQLGPGTAWSFANIGGTTIRAEAVRERGAKLVRIAMDKHTTNFESAQLWQMVSLERGVRYEVQCRMRRDTVAGGSNTPIVNFGMYHAGTNTWYGPIDVRLASANDWQTVRFIHIPPHAGQWRLYVQLNGWGNFGSELAVSFDDFSCRPAR